MRDLAKLGVLFLVFIAAGCGGRGGGSSLGGSSGALGVFVTDSFDNDFDHVWATIHRVELINAAGAAQTVFDDPAGRSVDLTTLRDGSGPRFLFLSDAVANGGSSPHTRVRCTLGNGMMLFPRGATSGQDTPVGDGLPRDGQGRPMVEFALASPRNMGSGHDDLVIDFDLPHFGMAGGKVMPALREGDKTGLHDGSRHESGHYMGTVSGLSGSAPNLTFTLTMMGAGMTPMLGGGVTVTVATGAGTALFSSDAAPGASLANGQRVEVEGTFDASASRLMATEIQILNDGSGGSSPPEVRGVTSAANAGAGTFVVATHMVEGFAPTRTSVTVVTTAATVFRSESGALLTAAGFFAKLATPQFVEVEGTYDAAGNTLAAARVKVEDARGMMTGGMPGGR